MASTKKAPGRGRPQTHTLTSVQEKSVISRLKKGATSKSIAEELDIHPFAVLRVRRNFNKSADSTAE